jgi:Secretion system C-terminal sorting domain
VTKNYLLLLTFLTCFGFGLQAQNTGVANPNWCGTHTVSPWLAWYHEHKQELALERGLDTARLYVPVTIHMVTESSGLGHYPVQEAFRIICTLNEQFSEARIQYYLHPNEPFIYHANSAWNSHDWSNGAEMIESTRIDDRLNCYIVNDPAGNCGYSWLDAIVMGRGCSGIDNTTWAHEAGHHFSLPHTFSGLEGEEIDYTEAPIDPSGTLFEKVDGSNCATAGDGFCDTEADYLNYRWQCNSDSRSTRTQVDPDGVEFQSDGTLYMSYAFDDCSSRFSGEQIEAMRNNLYTEHAAYLQTSLEVPPIDPSLSVQYLSPIDSAVTQYNNIVLNWQPVAGAEYYAVQISNSPFFGLLFYNQVVENTTTVTISSSVPNNRTLYWRVKPYSRWDVCDNQESENIGVFKTRNLSSTSELGSVGDVSLLPNPVGGGQTASLIVDNTETLETQLQIMDATGRVCYAANQRLFAGLNTLELPTQQLQAGVYIVSLRTDKGSVLRRLVVGD